LGCGQISGVDSSCELTHVIGKLEPGSIRVESVISRVELRFLSHTISPESLKRIHTSIFNLSPSRVSTSCQIHNDKWLVDVVDTCVLKLAYIIAHFLCTFRSTACQLCFPNRIIYLNINCIRSNCCS
jgi:hypothetical protein